MTTLWIFIGLVSISVFLLVFRTLLRSCPAGPMTRDTFGLTIYKDQLSELDNDLRRGLITEEEVVSARAEIERRILAAADKPETDDAQINLRGVQVPIALGIAILIPATAIILYTFLGSPHIPNVPYATRNIPVESAKMAKWQENRETLNLVKRLKNNLKNDTRNISSWVLLGRAYSNLARHTDAANAFEKAHTLAPNNTEILVQYAEALIPVENNVITEKIWDMFNQALTRNPLNPKARYYLALGKAQANNIRDAIQDWVDLIAISPKNASWLPTVRSQVNAAAQELGIDPSSFKPSARVIALRSSSRGLVSPGPDREELESASQMSTVQRQQMIRSMVERLADRLKKDPDDPDGWRRLAHAYRVLGESEKAANAESRANAYSN